MRIIKGIKPEIKPQTIFQLLGYNGTSGLSRKIENWVRKNIYYSHKILRPEALYMEKGIKEIRHDKLILNDNIIFKSSQLIHTVELILFLL